MKANKRNARFQQPTVAVARITPSMIEAVLGDPVQAGVSYDMSALVTARGVSSLVVTRS